MNIKNIINRTAGAVDHNNIGSLFGATNPSNLRGPITTQTAMAELMMIGAAGMGGALGQNPYGGGPAMGGQNPYGGNPGMGGQNPYGGNPGMGGQNPYGGNPGMGGQNPYGGNPGMGGQNPYGGGPVVGGAQNQYGGGPVVRGAQNQYGGGPVVGGAQNQYGGGPVVGGAQNQYGGGPVVGGAQNQYGGGPVVGGAQNQYGGGPVVGGAQNQYGGGPVVGGAQNQYGNPAPAAQNPYGNPAPAAQNPYGNPAPAAQNTNMIRRNRVGNHGTKLVPGQKWTVAAPNGAVPNRIRLCIGWDIVDPRCEVDASAFMICQNEKVPGDEWFVFYGSDVSPDGSVKYQSNKENPASPDDAEIIVELGRVRADIQKIPICATIYESLSRHLNFGMVKNVYARIVDDSNNELCYIPMVDLPNEVTSLVFGELYRHNNQWKFCAVSAGYTRDLAQFCNIYGVELE